MSRLFSEHLTIHRSILKFLMSPCWHMRSHQQGARRRAWNRGTHLFLFFFFFFWGHRAIWIHRARSIHSGQAEAPKAEARAEPSGSSTKRSSSAAHPTTFPWKFPDDSEPMIHSGGDYNGPTEPFGLVYTATMMERMTFLTKWRVTTKVFLWALHIIGADVLHNRHCAITIWHRPKVVLRTNRGTACSCYGTVPRFYIRWKQIFGNCIIAQTLPKDKYICTLLTSKYICTTPRN